MSYSMSKGINIIFTITIEGIDDFNPHVAEELSTWRLLPKQQYRYGYTAQFFAILDKHLDRTNTVQSCTVKHAFNGPTMNSYTQLFI